MKKIFTSLTVTALVSLSGYAQYTKIIPTEGELDLGINESGLMAIDFTLPSDAHVNNSELKFARLTCNDQVIAAVPSTNTQQVKFDNFMNYTWNIAFFRSSTPLASQPGKYEVTVDEGFFLIGEDNTPSEPLKLNYSISRPDILTTPASGQVKSLQDFSIVYKDYVKVERDEEVKICVFNYFGEDAQQEVVDEFYPLYNVDGNTVELALTDEISKSGTWRLEVQEGAFIGTLADGTTEKCPAVDETYVIPNHSAGPLYPSLPEGNIDEFPGVIELELEWGQKVRNVNSQGVSYIYPVDQYGNYGEPVARYRGYKKYITSTVVDNTKVQLINWVTKTVKNETTDEDETIPVSFTPAPGNYALVTANMLFNTVDNPKYQTTYVFNYTVLPSSIKSEITPNPNEVQNSLEQFTITFPEAKEVKLVDTSVNWMSSAISNYLFYPHAVQEGSKSVTFYTPLAITEKGEYTFYPVTSAIEVDGKFVSVAPVFTIDPAYSAVEGIEETATEYDVYSIDGKLVKKAATDLTGLSKGIYIAGGKKVIVK